MSRPGEESVIPQCVQEEEEEQEQEEECSNSFHSPLSSPIALHHDDEEIDGGLRLVFRTKLSEADEYYARLIKQKQSVTGNNNNNTHSGGSGNHYKTPRLKFHYAEVMWLQALITENEVHTKEAAKRLGMAEKAARNHCEMCKLGGGGGGLSFISGWNPFKKKSSSSSSSSSSTLSLKKLESSSAGGATGSSLVSSSRVDPRPVTEAVVKRGPKFSGEEDFSGWCLDSCSVVAHCVLMHACLLLRNGSYVQGGIRLRSAWKLYRGLLKRLEKEEGEGSSHEMSDAILADTYFGVGAFHFFVSLVPPSFRSVVELIGFEGDPKLGVEELKKCVSLGGSSRAALSRLLLLWIEAFFDEDLDSAEKLFELCAALYPESTLFFYLGGYIARRRGKLKDALNRFKKGEEFASPLSSLSSSSASKGTGTEAAGHLHHKWKEESRNSPVYPLRLMCIYEQGWTLYLMFEFEKAARLLKQFLKYFKAPSFVAYASYQLGYCLEFLGRHDEAIEVMKTVSSMARKHFSYDQYAKRMAKAFLKRPGLSPIRKILAQAFLKAEARKWKEAVKIVDQLDALIGKTETAQLKKRETMLSLNHRQSSKSLSLTSQPPPPASSSTEGDLAAPSKNNEEAMCKDVAALRRILRARAHVQFGQPQMAKVFYQSILEGEKDLREEMWTIPHALVELGDVLLDCEGDVEGAQSKYEQAKQYSGYDFDKPLHRRIQKALEKIKQMRSKASQK
eukprot:Nk52_evm4s639 gene=Nk52_evmTU4s639